MLSLGTLLASDEWRQYSSPFLLHKALVKQGIEVSHAAVKTWWGKHRVAEGSVRALTVQEVETQYGDQLRALAVEQNSAYKLCKAALSLSPPLCMSDALCRQWLHRCSEVGQRPYSFQLRAITATSHIVVVRLRQFGDGCEVELVRNARMLEEKYGERLRAVVQQFGGRAEALRDWCRTAEACSVLKPRWRWEERGGEKRRAKERRGEEKRGEWRRGEERRGE